MQVVFSTSDMLNQTVTCCCPLHVHSRSVDASGSSELNFGILENIDVQCQDNNQLNPESVALQMASNMFVL
jgi:hypothetical protein